MLHLHKEIWSEKAQNDAAAPHYERTDSFADSVRYMKESWAHRCFSFCVSSPRPAWQCSHDGTSSCACQAYKLWLRHTPAPPWPVTDTHTHTHLLGVFWGWLLKASQQFLYSCCHPAGSAGSLSRPLTSVSRHFLLCHMQPSRKTGTGSLQPWGSKDKQRKRTMCFKAVSKPSLDSVGARGNAHLKHITLRKGFNTSLALKIPAHEIHTSVMNSTYCPVSSAFLTWTGWYPQNQQIWRLCDRKVSVVAASRHNANSKPMSHQWRHLHVCVYQCYV